MMSSLYNVLLIFGTRPEAIKMAPVWQALCKYGSSFETRVLITAQHREMLDQVLKLFNIVPDYDLNIMSPRQSLVDLGARILQGIDGILNNTRFDCILVHGDTSTTFLASLVSYYHRIPVGHVEAGLRTNNIYSPFPEEMNRRLTGAIAKWHFAPTRQAYENLVKEHVDPDNIFITGNTVIDALLEVAAREDNKIPQVLTEISPSQKILLLTTHRRENHGDPLLRIYGALRRIVEENPEVEIIFPVHPNPAVRKAVREGMQGLDRVHLVDPLDYAPFVEVMKRSYLVLTDSGGIQEEAPALGKPVLVLRDTTERPEAVDAGTVLLVGSDPARIHVETSRLLRDRAAYDRMSRAINPYGDGKAAERIVGFILKQAGLMDQLPEPFSVVAVP